MLEVPPLAAEGLSDGELLQRLRCIYSEAFVAVVAKDLAELRQWVNDGLADESLAKELHERFTYRMHSLS